MHASDFDRPSLQLRPRCACTTTRDFDRFLHSCIRYVLTYRFFANETTKQYCNQLESGYTNSPRSAVRCI
jgi:hypothetical protein